MHLCGLNLDLFGRKEMKGKLIFIHFLKEISFLIWMSYCQVMTKILQGHIGKKNLRLSTRIRVFDCVGNRTF